jgi:hypothetical protein
MPDAELIDLLCRSARGVGGFKAGARIFTSRAIGANRFAIQPRRQ